MDSWFMVYGYMYGCYEVKPNLQVFELGFGKKPN